MSTNPAVGLEFESTMKDLSRQVRELQRRPSLTAATARYLTPELLPIPKAPLGLTILENIPYKLADGTTFMSRVKLSWDPVFLAADDSPIQVNEYEVWAERDGSDKYRLTAAVGTEARVDLPSGADMVLYVRAGTIRNLWSPYSAGLSVTGDIDTDPMDAPSAPTLTSNLGVIVVSWDGQLTSGPPPSKFRSIQAEVAPTISGPWTAAGNPFSRTGTAITGEPVGSTRYVRLIAQDSLGIESGPSSIAGPVTVLGVGPGQIEIGAVTIDDVDDTITGAIQDALDAANAINDRGNDLVRNGNGKDPLEENWSTWTSRHPEDAPTGTFASFEPPTSQSTNYLDDIIPIDPSKSYLASVWVRQTNLGVTSRFYYGVAPLDAAGLGISPSFYLERAGTRTTLAAALNPGDTVVQLTSGAGWNNANDAASFRSFIFWNYVDEFGKAWPAGTYSRNFYSGAWNAGGVSGNTITLAAPWSGPAIAAGTEVSNGGAGGTFMYPISNAAVPSSGEWTKYVGTPIGGILTDNTLAAQTSFPVATASVKIVMLRNYSAAGGTSKQRFAGVSFSDVAAAQATADTALSTADGKSTIIFSTADASGMDYAEGDLWFKKSGSLIVGQWEFVGGAWASRTIDNAVIANLDAGKLTAGIVDADRIGANTISTTKLLVGNLENLLEDPSFELDSTIAWATVGGVSKSGVAPRSGSRSLRMVSTTVAYEAARHQAAIPVQPGEEYLLSGWARMEGASASADGGLELSLVYGSTPTVTVAVAIADTPVIGTAYTRFFGTWTVPAGIYFVKPRIVIRDTVSGRPYLLDDVSFSRRLTGELIVDGTITTAALAADAITADKLAVNSVYAGAIQTNAVTANEIAANTITANELASESVIATKIKAGEIEVYHLKSGLGAALDISSNDSINLIVGEVETVQATADSTAATLVDMRNYYQFGSNEATISSPTSPYTLALSPAGVEIRSGAQVLSSWDANRMVVESMVVTKVILGNHQIEKFGDDTVVRAL